MDMKELTAPVTPEKKNRRGWLVAAAAFAGVIAVLAVAALLSRSTDELPPATTPPTTEAVPPTTSPTTTLAANDGEVFTLEFAPLPEGEWRFAPLGTALNVDVEGDWWVQLNSVGWVVLTHPDSGSFGDRDVVFVRPTDLHDPFDPEGRDRDNLWPVDDIAGWLDSVIDGVVISEPVDTEVGGANGIVFDVELASADTCQSRSRPGEACVRLAQTIGGDIGFEYGVRYRVYWLDQGEYEPIAIIVGASPALADEWFATADPLLANVSFGAPAPAPSD